MLETSLDRKIEVAHAVMERLDSGELLSNVLPQLKTLVGLEDNQTMTFFLDLTIYGMENIPGVKPPFEEQAQLKGGRLWAELCKTIDVKSIDVYSLIKDPASKRRPKRDHVINYSVFEMEQVSKAPPWESLSGRELLDRAFRIDLYYQEVQKTLAKLRSFLYDYASKIWQKSYREKERIQLLGPDYRLVLDSIGALNSEVANELTAALDNLRSENPANWALSALGCRNVILKLSRLLWTVPGDEYASMLIGATLNLKGNAEKNRLSAYIDVHWQEASDGEKRLLEEAHQLVSVIYNQGSKGKSGSRVRLAEAQALMVNTFRLVALLQETTDLTPLASSPLNVAPA